MTEVLRVGNASGFYGDRISAVREMLEGGDLDVLTGDYLAELTMLILGRDQLKDPSLGYAKTFLAQMRDDLALARARGVAVVTNAGGLNPAGLAAALREVDPQARVAHVEGDDLRGRAGELGLRHERYGDPLTANAYLGCWGIVAALRSGADVVVTGRVTDASLVVGGAAAHFGWDREAHDALAGATVAGHVLECGTHATGGNYSHLDEAGLSDPGRPALPGFPLAQIHPDGSSVVTKHAGTGGAVTVGTVTAQLLYEIGGPRYLGPDVVSRFDTVTLEEEGPDRVRISGARGEPPPPALKVGLNHLGGFRSSAEFLLTGLDIEAKAALVRRQLAATLPGLDDLDPVWTLVRGDHEDPDSEEAATARLRLHVRSADAKAVGKRFSRAVVELGLSSYAGFHLAGLPGEASPYGVFSAAYVHQDAVEHVVCLSDGTRLAVDAPRQVEQVADLPAPQPPPPPAGPCERAPLGRVLDARSGDKGGDANLGLWVRATGDAERDELAWCWLAHFVTPSRVRALLPEAAELPVHVHRLPNLRAVNVVVEGLLGAGVAASTRFDPQAKALGEWFRARYADVPEVLL